MIVENIKIFYFAFLALTACHEKPPENLPTQKIIHSNPLKTKISKDNDSRAAYLYDVDWGISVIEAITQIENSIAA